MTRRAFLRGAAALGISGTSLGAVVAACSPARRSSPPVTALPTGSPTDGRPVIEPQPGNATFGAMLELGSLVPIATGSGALASLLAEVAADTGIALEETPADGRRQARIAMSTHDPSLASQAYRLEIKAGADGPEVTITAADEAGAYNGLLSMAQLIAIQGSSRAIREASVEDVPGFTRRGAILDPYVRPDIGVTDESRALLLERVKLGVRYKLDFVDLPDREPWPELVRYCSDHHVELMVAKGYRDWLSAAPRQVVKDSLAAQLDAGAASLALCWDDIGATGEDLARAHAAVFSDLYDFVRRRAPETVMSAVLPPYGGVPGRHLVGSSAGEGERYLALMRDALPADVRVFWTGDGGVFSERVTTAGATAYADAVGHELGLWDNDALTFSSTRTPCRGRDPDLASVVHTYMGNLVGEAVWTGTNGEFALLTCLAYAWNPSRYEPDDAAARAERVLRSAPIPTGGRGMGA